MGKAVATIASVVGAVALIATGVGAVGGLALFGSTAGISIAGVSLSTLATIGSVAGAVGALARSTIGSGARPAAAANADRLTASINPSASRTMVFGRTAMATDVRFHAFTGTDQEYYWQVIAVASHKVEAIEELWLDDKLAWTIGGGVTTDFSGYLTVWPVLEGSASNITSINGAWGPAANTRLTGIAHLDLRFKRTGNSKKAESPFAGAIPSRMTIVGKGALCYDPRLDSTVPGGSGSHRADNQATWAWSRNAALHMLTRQIGWRINGKLAVGQGMPPTRADLPSYIEAANLCDEAVALLAGGTEPRYRFDGVFSEADDFNSVSAALRLAMNALLRDAGGRISLSVAYNDLATPIMAFTDDDVLGEFLWEQTGALSEDRNIGRGRYTDPSSNSLYQLVDYPEVVTASADGIDRILSIDLGGVQSPSQTQRLVKQALQRLKNQGVFRAELGVRAWGVQVGQVVTLTFNPLGFVNKLFRVAERPIDPFSGRSQVTLIEEFAALYAWDREEAPPVVATAPTVYNWQNNPLVPASLADVNATEGTKLGGIAPGADVTLDQPVVDRLNPTTGSALPNFISVDGRTFSKIAETGSARDGDVISFAGTMPAVPQIVFLPGGNTGTAGQNIQVIAEGLTTTGFTLRAKSQSVTPGSTVTDGSPTAGSGGEPAEVINRTSGSAPFDGAFRFNISTTVGTIGSGEPGFVSVGLFVKQSGTWNQIGTARRSVSATFTISVSPGAVDFGAGNEFGLTVLSSEGTGSTATLNSVAYTPGTVTETSLTPSGASNIPWVAYLQ